MSSADVSSLAVRLVLLGHTARFQPSPHWHWAIDVVDHAAVYWHRLTSVKCHSQWSWVDEEVRLSYLDQEILLTLARLIHIPNQRWQLHVRYVMKSHTLPCSPPMPHWWLPPMPLSACCAQSLVTVWPMDTTPWQYPDLMIIDYGIFTARRFASAVLATAIPSVCPSVRPSVTRRYCVKTTARSTVQSALSDSKMCLVLQKPKIFPRDDPFPLKSSLELTYPLMIAASLDTFCLVAPQP